MNNLKEYIIEKLHIDKNIKINNADFPVIEKELNLYVAYNLLFFDNLEQAKSSKVFNYINKWLKTNKVSKIRIYINKKKYTDFYFDDNILDDFIDDSTLINKFLNETTFDVVEDTTSIGETDIQVVSFENDDFLMIMYPQDLELLIQKV